MEYAFACERPIIFIDVPKKRNNPDDEKIGLVPIETSIRNKIGRIVKPSNLATLPEAIEDLYTDKDKFIGEIRHNRSEYVFNLGSAVEKSVAAILEMENN